MRRVISSFQISTNLLTTDLFEISLFFYLHLFIYDFDFRTCEAAIAGLEGVDDITDKYNIEFVKLNNKKYARNLGIRFDTFFGIFKNCETKRENLQ